MQTILLSFFTAIDAHDWTGARRTLSDTVDMGGGRVLGGDELIALSRATGGGFAWTSHNMIHYGETAGGATFDLVAVHYLPIPSGENFYTLVRRITARFDAEGRISGLEAHSSEETGNRGLLDIVRAS